MSSLITIEDYNSTLYNYKDSFIYKIPTSSITAGGHMWDNKFNINKVLVSGGRYKYTLQFKTNIWNGMYYVLNEDNEVVNSSASYNYSNGTHTLEIIVPNSANYYIGLYMSPLINEAGSVTISEIYYNVILENNVFLKGVNEKYTFTVTRFGNVTDDWDFTLKLKRTDGRDVDITNYNLIEIDEQTVKVQFIKGNYDIQDSIELDVGIDYTNKFPFYRKRFKNKNIVEIVDNTIFNAGRINELNFLLTHTSKANYPISCTIKYNDIEDTFELNVDEYIISRNIDLRNKLDENPVKISVNLTEGYDTYKQSYDFLIPCEYKKISTFEELSDELNGIGNSRIMEISDDILFTTAILINHDVIIKGENHILDLNGYGFTVNDDCNVQISYLNFNNGDCAFVQRNNSILELDNCNFNNCKATAFNGLGSVIHCDIHIDNLDQSNDFFTIMKNNQIVNCGGSIYHSGELLFENNKFLLNDYEYVDNNSPAFLYQVDGSCNINNNIFDIDLDTDYYCNNEINLKLGQCLFVCGDNASINHSNSDFLKNNDNSSLFDVHNNIVHTFAKYYYSPIESCVYVSPMSGKEDRCVCYAVSGLDWIFKENIQITRASWQSENRINNLRWL